MESDPLLSGQRYVALLRENSALRAMIAGLREVLEELKASAERTEKLLITLEERLAKGQPQQFQAAEFGWTGRASVPAFCPTGRRRGRQLGPRAC